MEEGNTAFDTAKREAGTEGRAQLAGITGGGEIFRARFLNILQCPCWPIPHFGTFDRAVASPRATGIGLRCFLKMGSHHGTCPYRKGDASDMPDALNNKSSRIRACFRHVN